MVAVILKCGDPNKMGIEACLGWMQFMHVPDERSLFMLLMDGVRIGVHAALTAALHSRCMAKPV